MEANSCKFTKLQNKSSCDEEEMFNGSEDDEKDISPEVRPFTQYERFSMNDMEIAEEIDFKISIKPDVLDIKKLNLIQPRKIPCSFIGKYIGKRHCSGLSGLKVIRGPIDEIVNNIIKLRVNHDFPLVRINVNESLLMLDEHNLNTGKNFPTITFPISSISFASQDRKYRRIMALIETKRLSLSNYLTDCHIIIFPDPYITKEIILTLQLIFNNQNVPVGNDLKDVFKLSNPVDFGTESSI